jgi:hypothetical protein
VGGYRAVMTKRIAWPLTHLEVLLPVIYRHPPGLSTVSAAKSTPICVIGGYRYWVLRSSSIA